MTFEQWWLEIMKPNLDTLPLDPAQCLKAVAQKAWDKGQVVAWQAAGKLI